MRRGFTLVELLVVVGVMAVMMSLVIPAFQNVRGGSDFSSSVYDIAGAFEQARAYAMANNTFVLAGVMEANASNSSSTSPQVAGIGRLAIAVVASRNGTRPYDVTALSNWTSIYGTGLSTTNGGGLTPVVKLATFRGIHMVDLQDAGSVPPATGNMARPSVPVAYNLSNSQMDSQSGATEFGWPLGVPLTTPPQYTFLRVVEFDPLGSARILNVANSDAIPHFIELGLEPCHGTSVPATPSNQNVGQIAAIQIDGMSSAVRIYRP
ncbi:MAG TPA: prepilin-type N-terminal cleavage/methylation domain-containing protein [Chthoniobacteraceae bacterium]|jgi:prepilin-type N-terminal cleavage/methylation domain-containing protein|nr:prepilin-type N-terminal cleavage/methylation domain-containing protein [Chthoniobacteraceae bacterium]